MGRHKMAAVYIEQLGNKGNCQQFVIIIDNNLWSKLAKMSENINDI